MKKTILLLLGIICACACFAQQRPKVLIGDNIEAISGFGGPFFQFTVVDKKAAVMSGGGGAVILNNMMYFGGYGMSLVTDLERTSINGERYLIDYNHGGFMIGYIFNPVEIAHLGFSTKLGWGDITMENRSNPAELTEYDNIFVFAPQIEGEINVTQWFKLNAAVGYNGVIGVSNDLYRPIDFNKPQLSLSLLFGWFY